VVVEGSREVVVAATWGVGLVGGQVMANSCYTDGTSESTAAVFESYHVCVTMIPLLLLYCYQHLASCICYLLLILLCALPPVVLQFEPEAGARHRLLGHLP
jgi:hypothetical protein